MTVKLSREVARKVLETIDAGLVAGVGIPEPGKMCVEAAVCYALGLPHGDNPDDCVAQPLRALKMALNDQSWRNAAARAKGMRRLGIAQLGSKGMDEKEFLRRLSEFTVGVIVPRVLRSAIKSGADKSLEHHAARCEKEKSYDAADAAYAGAYAAYAHADAAHADADADAADAAAKAAHAAYAAAAYAAYAAYAAADAAAKAARAADAEAAARAADAAADAADAAADAAHAADAEREFFAEGVVQILVKMKVPGTKWLDLTN